MPATNESKPNCVMRLADLASDDDAHVVLQLLEHYSQHPMGSGGPLQADVKETVIAGLKQHPTTRIFFAEIDKVVVGMAICFVGFSTFKAKPLINIHDLIVHEGARGRGIGGALLDAVAAYAQEQAWCAVTLEVRADNPARRLYAQKGFRDLTEPFNDQTMLFGKLVFSSSDHAS